MDNGVDLEEKGVKEELTNNAELTASNASIHLQHALVIGELGGYHCIP